MSLTQLSDQVLISEGLMPLLAEYRLLPQLLRERLIDEAIAAFPATPEETGAACQRFYQQHEANTETAQQAWRDRYGLTVSQVEAIVMRPCRIEKFKAATWSNKIPSYFLERKADLDRVIYSLIRTRDWGVAQELFFRVEGGEQTFGELAQIYSQGSEAQTAGLVGPVEVGTLPPKLKEVLRSGQPGKICQPIALGEWVVLVRLEKIVPVQLNEAMHQRLLRDLFENWLKQQMTQLPETDRQWLELGMSRGLPVAAPVAA